ncbi:hypothetical protein RIF29_16515 [Crotalaria pallida]|uniref:Secreted protein n=1 Tax=Crotalaria pallida TaxID=3830 RepID=A0AAN9FFD9_CROPI
MWFRLSFIGFELSLLEVETMMHIFSVTCTGTIENLCPYCSVYCDCSNEIYHLLTASAMVLNFGYGWHCWHHGADCAMKL